MKGELYLRNAFNSIITSIIVICLFYISFFPSSVTFAELERSQGYFYLQPIYSTNDEENANFTVVTDGDMNTYDNLRSNPNPVFKFESPETVTHVYLTNRSGSAVIRFYDSENFLIREMTTSGITLNTFYDIQDVENVSKIIVTVTSGTDVGYG